ncbi:MAG: phospho-N-acetylmuramoyl-pentapeptide-transferase [Lachnospiraceae bacterium]|jgi:phospho-N-acetylmuramoyl-pentapeptide-transferase|nr:phospho-N-acetylmuramoyl-pentapeptide-transferase [Lachnospiraceae bacterium]MCI1726505.1 phospho-N-acetylmuramoyl-pentapeptide-transferase [Lachnospiraceae bacterium]
MVDLSAVMPAFIAFAISAVLGPVFIPFLTKLKLDQTERKLGVQSHLKKAGTPTMGGIIFLIAIAVTSVLFFVRYPRIGPVIFLTMAFGLVGFLDDYLKVVKKRSDGLFAWQKFGLQFIITVLFWLYLTNLTDIDLTLRIPFTHGAMADIGFWAVPLLFFAVLGTVNGVNFTDGIDGLASSVTVVVSVFFVIASLLTQAGVEPVASAAAGALMGFLLYNAYPARIFMGDTGSLALGGFVIGTAYMMHMPLYILMVGLIYLVEVVSVILQVGYFKATHGKRLFKMAPIHHHFELCGWSETRVVAVFTIVTVLLSLLALLAL